jgi:hypothetical protein
MLLYLVGHGQRWHLQPPFEVGDVTISWTANYASIDRGAMTLRECLGSSFFKI